MVLFYKSKGDRHVTVKIFKGEPKHQLLLYLSVNFLWNLLSLKDGA